MLQFFISIAMVIGPMPPGTGVIAPAISFTFSKSTSPHSFPASLRFIPTSMRIAPSFTISAVTVFTLPTALTIISAPRQISARFLVLEWQIVTVPFSCINSIATGYGRAAELRDAAQVQKALNALGEIEVRKMMPWEKLLSDRQEQETYYTMMIWYDSETEGRYESLACWEGGRIDFRDTAYMITGKEKTKATDLLEGLLQEYETAE